MLKNSFRSSLLITAVMSVLFSGTVAAQTGTMQNLGTLRHDEVSGSTSAPSTAFYPQSPSTGSDAIPQPIQVGDITYVTGGVGDEERNNLAAVKNNYNLHITSASKSGEFVGDTQISIFDRSGTEMLNAASGPIFFAKLPPGHYVVQAASGGEMKKQAITIGNNKAAHIHLSW